jgi:hypothetical protein
MLIRLLVAVLALVGPLPLRVCTCAASTPAQSAPAKVKKCRCADCGPVADAAARDTSPTPCEAAPQSNPHDHDCPAVNPRPGARDIGTPPAPDTATEAPAVVSEPLTLARAPVPIAFKRTHTPRTPLYITFLALRN